VCVAGDLAGPEKSGCREHQLQAAWPPQGNDCLRVTMGVENLLARRCAQHRAAQLVVDTTTAAATAGTCYASPGAGCNPKLEMERKP
jgi:hypothetical protein